MSTAFQLTSAQARKLGISTEEKQTSKPRVQLTPEEKAVQARIKQAKLFVESITILCENYGWKIGLCRLPSTDPRNEDYPSIKDYEAIPNAIMAWRDGVAYANPRTMFLAWLWEIPEMSEEEMVVRVNRLKVAA